MVMRKDPSDKALPGDFVKVPVAVLNSKLTHPELRLWLLIEAHRFSGKESCYPSNDRLADLMGLKRRRIIAMKSALVKKGFLAVKDRPGKSALLTPLVNGQPVQEMTPVQHNAPVQKSAHLEISEPAQPTVTTDISSKPIDPCSLLHPCTKEHGGGAEKCTPGVQKNAPESDVLKQSTESVQSSSPKAKPGKTTNRNTKKETDPRIKKAIDYFHDEHLRIHDEKPHIIGGRDSKAIERLLKTVPDIEELKRRILPYLNDSLSWMDHPQWTITGFEKRINAYGRSKRNNETYSTAHKAFNFMENSQ
jgi:hypothetical protein